MFGHSRSYLSLIFNDVLEHVFLRFKTLWWDARRLTLPTIEKYARAIQNEVGTEGVWGFIDGTIQPFCRPGENQEQYYSGHKKNHGFQFQCIMTPDGLMSSLHGPYTGPTADWNMWKDSELEGQLRAIFLNEDARAAAEQPEGI